MALILPNKAKNNKKNIVVGNGIKPSKSIQDQYLKALMQYVLLIDIANENIKNLYDKGFSQATIDQSIAQHKNRIDALIESSAIIILNNFANNLNSYNSKKFKDVIKKALKADFVGIDNEIGIEDHLQLIVSRNVRLIKTINHDNFSKLTQAVVNNFNGIKTNGLSLTDRINELSNISRNHANLIARDQTAKATSELTRIRNIESGIEKYHWSNSRDSRVVGNPEGKYPKGNVMHNNHWIREMKVFYYNSPPQDGHAGMAIQCRCVELPIIEIDKLNVIYI